MIMSFKKQSKGFTLVELLAVIVILGIIMIIAIPSVLQVMSTSKIKSFSVYAKKVRTEAEKKNYKDELDGNKSTTGMYIYDIKEDLDLSSTGNYKGYVVINGCSNSKEYYVFLADDTYMVFDYSDSDPENIEDFEKFSNYNETSWSESASTKEQVAGRVLNLVGDYSCKVYNAAGTEIYDGGSSGGATEIPNTPTSSNVAIFDKGVKVAYTMLNSLSGNTNFVIKSGVDANGKTLDFISSTNNSITYDTSIKAVMRSETITPEQEAKAIEVQSSDSPNKILMWFENGTIYWYTPVKKVFANKDASYMFVSLGGLTSLDVSEIDFSQTENIEEIFSYDVGISSIDVSSMNVANVKSIDGAFYNMTAMTMLNISMWNTKNVETASFAFAYMGNLQTLKLPNDFITTKTNNIMGLFMNDKKLVNVDVSNFKTDNITSLYGVFIYCQALKSLDLSSWNVSKVTSLFGLFSYTTLTSLDVSTWDTSNVDDYSNIFYQAKGVTVLDLSSWKIKSGASLTGAFYNATKLNTIYTSYSWKSDIGSGGNMFNNDTKLVGGNGTKFANGKISKTYAVIDGENGQAGYFTLKSA